ncbi:MAG: hypothetical protein BHW34_02450 [Firmicutes bacterium CAG:176_59_8]|nr:MAG: hypothetical protein BHW34_02450 [Firmicutes bacterium CAG:176_59_8]
MRQRKGNSVGDRILMILVGLFLYAPIIILIVFSFNAGNSSSVWKGFSLHWYAELLQNRLIMHSVYTTLLVSLLATLIATVAGTFAAIGFYAMRRKPRETLMAVNNIPMMNADIVTGVSLCLLFVVFFNGWGAFAGWVNSWQSAVVLPERLTMGFGTLLIAHVCFNIPYVLLSVGPKLRQMDRNLIDAAQDLGCTWMQAFWKVMIPEIKPGIVSGALTAFTMSIDDFIISYFTAGTSSSTLAMTIYGMTKKRVSPEINAVSTLLFVTVILLLAVINLRENHAEHHRAAHRETSAPAPAPKKHPGLGKKLAAGGLACVLLATLIVTGTAARSERVVDRHPRQLPDGGEQRGAVLPYQDGRRGLRCHRSLRLHDRPADPGGYVGGAELRPHPQLPEDRPPVHPPELRPGEQVHRSLHLGQRRHHLQHRHGV